MKKTIVFYLCNFYQCLTIYLFTEKRPASPIISSYHSTPKKRRNETVDVFNEPRISELMSEQLPSQKDDFNINLRKNNKTSHKAKNKKNKEKKAKKTKKSKKNEKKNKIKGSDQDYESDKYIDCTDRENMTTWNEEIHGTIVS